MLENEISVWLPTLGWKVLTEIGFEIFERYSETGSRFASGRSCHLAVIFSSPTAFTGPNTNAQFLHKFLEAGLLPEDPTSWQFFSARPMHSLVLAQMLSFYISFWKPGCFRNILSAGSSFQLAHCIHCS